MTAAQLKACPFCGAAACMWTDDETWRTKAEYVSCNECHGCVGPCETKEEAITAWNTRPTAVASHAEGEVKQVAEMVYFKRKGSVFEDCLPVMPGQHGNYVRGDLITRVVQLYANPPRSGDEAGHVVVTRDSTGEIVAVTRQDDEGRILSVIDEKLTDEQRRKFTAEYALTHMSVQAAMAARGGGSDE